MTTTTKTEFKQTEVGMIHENWEIKILSQLGAIVTGKTPRTADKGNFGDEYPFITPRDMKGQKHIIETERYLSRKGKESVGNISIPEGSICVSCIGSDMGKVVMTTRESITNQQINSIVPTVSGDFVYYAVLNISPRIKNLGKQSTAIPILNKTQFSMLKVAVPSREIELNAIGKILSDLDSKIELNHRMNKNLEAIGKAIFKHWFVDFEFPNEEGKPYKSSGAEMLYNEELGKEIPEGWEVKRFSEVVAINPKRDLPRGKLAKKVGMAGLNTWQSWIESWTLEEYKTGPKFRNGDTLFARITPSLEHGKTAIVSILDNNETGFGSTEFIVLGRKELSSQLYIFHLCRSEEIRAAAINSMTGTSGRQRVPDSLFDSLSVAIPPSALIEKFDSIVLSQFDKISTNSKEVRTLSTIRDSLLPKLMSGKIRVPVQAR